jgi:hypothetical protein
MLVVAHVLLVPISAEAAFQTGFAGPEYQSPDAGGRAAALERTVDAGAQIVRLGVPWRAIASSRPADPTNPLDPAYNFAALDEAVADATAAGLTPLLTVSGAPTYAEGGRRPPGAAEGTWKPDPSLLGQFAHALAARYSGNVPGLPRARYYQAWNEPNLSDHLAPQYHGKRAVAASLYRRMLNQFYSGVKSVDQGNVVVTGGTGPYGDDPGGERTRPLVFWREVLCLKGQRHLRKTKCAQRPKFDVLAHHPINTSGPPTRSAIDPDDASTPDFKHVGQVLRAAERLHTTGTAGRHPLWATEIWWSTDPPDRRLGVSPAKQARYLAQALYLLYKQGAKVVINLSLEDPPSGKPVAAGVLFADGSPKPSFEGFRFPFVTERRGRGLRAWGKAPATGRLEIQRRQDGWRTVKSLDVVAGRVFSARLALRGRQRLRAVVGTEQSLPWNQR